MLKNENTLKKTNDPDICPVEKRKLYTKPYLEEIGDLRTLTLGGSPGWDESGPSGDLMYDRMS